MELRDFLDHVNRGALIEAVSEQHRSMHGAAQEALRTVAEINTGYRTRRKPDPRQGHLRQHGLRFQDTGGITIGDGTLIGHGSTLTTLDHGIDPDRRGT